jgi:hypothetical protein
MCLGMRKFLLFKHSGMSCPGRVAVDGGEPFSLLTGGGSLPSAAPEVDELTEPLQTLEVQELETQAELDTAQQQEDDPYWLPPDISRAPEGKCKSGVQVSCLSSSPHPPQICGP